MTIIDISVERHSSGKDLRCTGSNLDTGCKAVFLLNDKKYTRKIYMTNSGKSLHFYIKWNGKNSLLENKEVMFAGYHTSHLTSKLWEISI